MGIEFHKVTGVLSPFDQKAFLALAEKMLGDGDHIILVIDSEGQAVGMAGALAYPTWYCPEEMTGQDLFWWVDPEHRGSGGLLLDALEAWAMGMGAVTFSMASMSASEGDRVGRIYERRGYRAQETTYTKRF